MNPWPKRFFYLAVMLCVIVIMVFIPMMLFHDTPPQISRETTYLTEPLTADGKRIDYFLATEQRRYPPEMQTDDNGYRLIVQAFGAPSDLADPVLRAQYYEKLGLLATHTPTMPYLGAYEYLPNYFSTNPDEFEEMKSLHLELRIAELRAEAGPDMASHIAALENEEIDEGLLAHYIIEQQRRNYAKFPVIRQWITEAAPMLDIIAEAVRKPIYVVPMVRLSDKQMLTDDVYSGASAFGLHREFARSLGYRVHNRLWQGDIDGVIDDLITLRRLELLVGNQGTLIDAFLGIAIGEPDNTIGPNKNPEFPMNAEQIRRFLRELGDLPQRYDETKLFEMERLITLDLAQAAAYAPRRREALADITGSHSSALWHSRISDSVIWSLGYNWNTIMKEINRDYDHIFDPAYIPPVYSESPLAQLGWLGTNSRSRRIGVYFGDTTNLRPIFLDFGRRSDCRNNMQRIVLAMLLYEREHGTLPPVFTTDITGKPLHSWRVLLLPYLGEQELYENLRLDQPWDSEHNRQFQDTMPVVYQCPSTVANASATEGQKNYTVIVGSDTPFGADGKGRLTKDFSPYTVLLTERRDFVPWMQPDTEVSQADAEAPGVTSNPTIGSDHNGGGGSYFSVSGFIYTPGGANCGYLSGTVRFKHEVQLPNLKNQIRGTAESY